MDTDSLPSPEPEPYQQVTASFLDAFGTFTPEIGFAFFVIIVLLFLSAIVSGSEVAFFSMNPNDIDELEQSAEVKDKRILELLSRPRMLLATVLVSNNFINIAIIILFNYVIGSLLITDNTIVQFIVNIVVVTSLLVFFGEVSPKVFATQNKFTLARFSSSLLKFFRTIFYPISWLLVSSGLFLESKIKKRVHEIDLVEIEKAIELSTTRGSSKEDIDMLKGIVHFGNTTVKQIMTPRMDIVGIEHNQTYDQIIAEIKKSGFSRMPVYVENIDKIEGVLYAKDLLGTLDEKPDFKWHQLIREVIFVPETKKIDDLLREIQENRKHQAIVVDEYGGTSGLITLEDILEEVVGDIKDEFDEDLEQEYKKIDDHNYIFDGKIMLNDLYRVLELDNETFDEAKGEADSLAGMLLELLGVIPKNGVKISYKKYDFQILALEKNRIKRVKLTINEEE